MYLIRPESLCTHAILQLGFVTRLPSQQTGQGNHDAVVDTEALVRRVDAAAPISGHLAHHLLEPLVAADAADDEDLAGPDVGHGPLRDLDQHGEDGLLQREAEVRGGDADLAVPELAALLGQHLVLRGHLRGQDVGGRQDPAEAAVHALDGVGQVEQHGRPPARRRRLGQLLHVVPRERVVGDAQRAREAVDAVADGDVEGLAKDAVPLGRVGDDLGVAARHVQHNRVGRARDDAAHLNVPDAVVDADEGLVPEQGQRARAHGHRGQRRAHAGALREADAGQLVGGHAGVAQGGRGHGRKVPPVVQRRVLGQEARARGRDERVPHVGEDGRRAERRVVR